MRIESAHSNCNGVQEFVTNAASWIGKTVTAAGSAIAEGTRKVAEFVRPFFAHMMRFARENKESLLIAGAGFTIGLLSYHVMNNLFCKGTNTTPYEETSEVATV